MAETPATTTATCNVCGRAPHHGVRPRDVGVALWPLASDD